MTRERARALRKLSTEAEKKLWYYLRNRRLQGYKFKRQFPIENYIVDFICIDQKLIVEVDGSQHLKQIIYDNKRTEKLQTHGFSILRVWNNDVLGTIDIVLDQILFCLQNHCA